MIQITNNFLPSNIFNWLQTYTAVNQFEIIKAGDKEFCTLPTPKDLLDQLQIPGHEIILTFIRKAYPGFDNTWRIHADNLIQGHKAALASVLYININEGVTPNGTAFWSHPLYGERLPDDVSPQEFDRLLTEESNNVDLWEKGAFVPAQPNRLLVYDAQRFHSKFPNEITKGERTVLVTFYKKTKQPC